ncbi:hypothetical protein OUZ56_017505 [Daphnia magna]|uniref:Uncharacterized protein n=1 Tax=Daphnia magna TaxID=35525 RepID=A0ABR0AT43_9CRUS|nr:hypothetical protein OUZ56_017505 [Daphnia magna]
MRKVCHLDVECPKTVLKEKLIDMEQQRSICHCMSLVGCLLNSISARFDHLFLEKHLRLASLSDPHLWVRDKETKYSDTEFLKNEVQRRTAAAVELQIDSEADSSPNRKRSRNSTARYPTPLYVNGFLVHPDSDGNTRLLNVFSRPQSLTTSHPSQSHHVFFKIFHNKF